MPATSAIPETQHFSLTFGLKASPDETEWDGEVGIFGEGYCTEFNALDKQEEWTDPTSFATAARTFFKSDRNGSLPILYEHGFDPLLLTSRLGRVVDHRIDDVGVWVKFWLPKPNDVVDEIGQKALQVYNNVRAGLVHALSIGGMFGKIGKKIARVGLYEISLTERPVLPSAVFALAQKSMPAVDAMMAEGQGAEVISNPLDDPESFMGALHGFVRDLALGSGQKAWPKGQQMPPWMAEKVDKQRANAPPPPKNDGTDGPRHADTIQHGLSREGHGQAMKIAVRDKSQALHDHLLDPTHYPPEAQSAHDPETCPVDQHRRDVQGIKGTPDEDPSPAGCACTCGCPDCTCSGAQNVGGKSEPLSPAELPHTMTDLASLAFEVAQLHALSSAEDGERVGLEPGAKAGKTLSGLSMQTLRAFASQVTAAGQALHEWLDKNQPDPEPPAPAGPAGGTAGGQASAGTRAKQAALSAATGKS